MFQFNILSLINLIVGIIALVFAAVIWARRPAPGSVPFTVFMLAVVVWIFFLTFEFAAVDYDTKIFLGKLIYFVTVTTAIMWLCFSQDYTGSRWWRRPRNLLILFAIPVASLGIWLTSQWGVWGWLRLQADIGLSNAIPIWKHGPLFWMQAIYISALFLSGFVLLSHFVLTGRDANRRKVLPILISTMVPVVCHFSMVMGYIPSAWAFFTPFSLAAAGIIYGLTILQFRFLNVVLLVRGTLVEIMTDGIIVIDKESIIVDINPSAARILDLNKESASGRRIEQVCQWLGKEIKNIGDGQSKELFSSPSESGRYLETSVTPILNNKSLINGRLVVIRDVTERWEMDRKLGEIETRYSVLVEQSSEGVLIVQQGIYKFANQTLAKLTGYPVEEIIGQIVPQGVAENDIPMVKERCHLRSEGQSVPDVYEVSIKSKSGKIIEAEISVGRIIYKGAIANIVTVRDITKRKKVQEVIKASEEKYRSLVNNIKLGVFRSSLKGKYLEANKAMETITGYSREELLHMDISDLFLYPEDRQAILDQSISMTKEADREIWHKKKDGTEIIGSISITPIRDPNGNVIYFDGILEDVTERKKLTELIRDLYEKEKSHRQELEEETKARGLFIDVLGHELRTPLTPLVLSAEMLKNSFDGDPEGIQSKLIGNLNYGAQILVKRLEELLDLGRYLSGNISLDIQLLDIRKVIDEVVSQIQPVINKKDQRLILALTKNLPQVEADVSHLEQVLINLLHNASKFTPEGGNITLKAKQSDKYMLIEVQDEGEGISLEEQQHLFQPYHRVEQDRLRFPGLGLGLAISKHTIETHQGRIWVTSHPGCGSTFSFLLPLNQNNVEPCTNTSIRNKPVSNKHW